MTSRDDRSRPVRRVELDAAVEVDRAAWWAKIPAVRAVLDHGLNIPAGACAAQCTPPLGQLGDLRSDGAQVVVATHSPLLTALPGATILGLGAHGIRRAEWADLEIVANWRGFLDSPAAYLRHLSL